MIRCSAYFLSSSIQVYVVTHGQYSDYSIDAIFSAREKAELFIAAFETKYRWDELKIEEWTLDHNELRPGMKAYFLRIRKNGEIYQVEPTGSTYGFDQFCGYAIDDTMFMHVFAEDEGHAKKIASERWAIVLGTCGWGNIPPAASAQSSP